MRKTALLRSMILAGTTFASLTSEAQVPTPFNVTVRNYAYVGKPGFNSNVANIVLHRTLNPTAYDGGFDSGTTVTFTNITAQSLNAAGINRLDGYMYGMEYLYGGPYSTSTRLYRVGANAVATAIGIVAGPTAANAGRSIQFGYVNLASGTIDTLGNYWFNAYSYTDLNPPVTASKVDMYLGKISGLSLYSALSANTVITPTYYKLDISDTIIQRGVTNLATQQAALIAYGLPPTNSDGGWQDMDFSPVNNRLYSYIAFPSSPSVIGSNPYPKPPLNSYLSYINMNVSPWKMEIVNTTPNTVPNVEEDGAYFVGNGDYYIVFTDGEYTRVNLTTGALDTLAPSSLPLNSGNMRGDLASNPVGPALTPINPLPIALMSFSGKKDGTVTDLTWRTGLEMGFDHFELQRSKDGKDFTSIATLSPTGSNSTYTHIDNDAYGTMYYRLKLVFNEGTINYSSTIRIDAKGISTASNIYPTIVTDGQLHITSPASQVGVSVYSLTGQVVQTQSFNGVNGSNQYNISLTLPTGTYIVRVSDPATGEALATSRIIIP